MPTFGLYAKEWIPVVYTVTYDGNGNTSGSVPIDSNFYEELDSVTVLGNTGSLAKDALTFIEWNTASDGSGTSYDGGDSFAMGAANVTLYAVYALTYIVTYNGNENTSGSVPVDSNNYEELDSVTVLGNTGSLAKDDFTFIEWNTASDGSGTSYGGGDSFAMGAANVTLYAVYALIYTLVSDATWLTSTSVIGGDNTCPATLGLSPAWTAIGYDDSLWVNAAVWDTHTIWAPGAIIDRGPPKVAYLRKTFTLPGILLSGYYFVAVDDCAQGYVNGQLVDDGYQPGAGPRGPFNILPYLQEGVNVIAIKAWDGTNCTIKERGLRGIEIEINIGLPIPLVVDFYNPPVTALSPIQFTDTTTGDPDTWDWDFGDGSPHSTEQNPIHEYFLNRIYYVTLIASNSEDSGTITKAVGQNMSITIISGTLFLEGDFACNGDVYIATSGRVIPVPDPDLMKTFYSYQTNSYITGNGGSRKITSTTGNVIINGVIDGEGAGFESNRGPGCNSLLTDSTGNPLGGYGASHAGLGYISNRG